jgi:hypothetical protein
MNVGLVGAAIYTIQLRSRLSQPCGAQLEFCAAAAYAEKTTAAIAAITDLIIVSPAMPYGISRSLARSRWYRVPTSSG